MGNLTRNFNRMEFACRCGCGFGAAPGDVNPVLAEHLQAIRDRLGVPLLIASGCRCAEHNASVGGVRSSQHLLGNAADVFCALSLGALHAAVLDHLREADPAGEAFGVGVYHAGNFIHFDVRRHGARWED